MPTLLKCLAVVAFASLVPACGGRTPMEPTECMIQVEQKSLDFGVVSPGDTASRVVRLMNVGGQTCHLFSPALGFQSDEWFSTDGSNYPTQVAPQEVVSFSVTFQPQTAILPLTRSGEFRVEIAGPNYGIVQVPVTGRVKSDCHLVLTPPAVDFGTVSLRDTATQIIHVENAGNGPCEIRDIELAKTGDAQFNLPERPPLIVSLGPSQATAITVAFSPVDLTLPRQRTSSLQFSATDDAQPNLDIPLSANIDIGCELSWSPPSNDFGQVTLNKTAIATVILKNIGTSDCWPTTFGFTKDSHLDFAMDLSQPLPSRIPPEGTDTVTLTFTAADISPPHLKTATFGFLTSDKQRPEARIPLSATVDTFCKEASKWIYTLDTDNTLSKFDPSTKTFTTIAVLTCTNASTPNSMAVDQNAVAWVAYNDGNLFKVDTTTGKCEPTAFVRDQQGLHVFGMGFVFDPATNTDTLYIAGGASISVPTAKLATISFPQLQVSTFGTVNAGMPELSGTGDGSLWGFFPDAHSSTGISALVKIDPLSGNVIEQYQYPSISVNYSWAMKFWGGSFWVFVDKTVYEVKRDDPQTIVSVIPNSGHQVVGAGVSSCAPLRK